MAGNCISIMAATIKGGGGHQAETLPRFRNKQFQSSDCLYQCPSCGPLAGVSKYDLKGDIICPICRKETLEYIKTGKKLIKHKKKTETKLEDKDHPLKVSVEIVDWQRIKLVPCLLPKDIYYKLIIFTLINKGKNDEDIMKVLGLNPSTIIQYKNELLSDGFTDDVFQMWYPYLKTLFRSEI